MYILVICSNIKLKCATIVKLLQLKVSEHCDLGIILTYEGSKVTKLWRAAVTLILVVEKNCKKHFYSGRLPLKVCGNRIWKTCISETRLFLRKRPWPPAKTGSGIRNNSLASVIGLRSQTLLVFIWRFYHK